MEVNSPRQLIRCVLMKFGKFHYLARERFSPKTPRRVSTVPELLEQIPPNTRSLVRHFVPINFGPFGKAAEYETMPKAARENDNSNRHLAQIESI